ncbi:MAG: thioredoxin [Leptotrichiaceae bacterium]|nr:thioredoxin [Leptotrichiaceae bacterium]MBP7100706.1 thioredoxin [Leptotrichiaceae bacterium]MBP7739457.1 thioredoxin [Leptotrichiaceae bacterium]MBP9629774.1 thioredoxin [Leptotrichiaceae bacterium]
MMKIMKFEKEDCSPCAMVSELLDKNGVEYEKINPFNNPELAVKFKVRSVPTTILIDNDLEVKRIIGFKLDELNDLIEMI